MKKGILAQVDALLLSIVGIIFIIKVIFGLELMWFSAAISIIILLRYLPSMSSAYKFPAWIFTIVGLGTMIYSHATLQEIAEGTTSMLSTVAIVTVMQTLSIAIGCGNYGENISKFIGRYSRNEGKLYIFIEIFSHLLCSILNLGEVVIILNSITKKISDNVVEYPKFISSAISKGHCTAFLWAPGSVTVLLTLQIFKIDWVDYVGPAISVAVIGMLVSGIIEYRNLRKHVLIEEEIYLTKTDVFKLSIIVLVILAIIANMIFLKKLYITASGTEILVLDVFMVSLIWILFQVKSPKIKGEISKFTRKTLPQMGSLCAFFLSMGIFSAGMQCIGIGVILESTTGVIKNLPGIAILAIVPIVVILFSMIGIHPMVSLAVLGPIMLELVGNVTSMQLALATAMGCCLAYMVSPFAGLILFLSQQLNLPSKEIALKYNLLHAVVYFFIGLGAIYIIF